MMRIPAEARAGHRAVDPAQYRHVLGHFASGVTIVTAVDRILAVDAPVGFTCQAFAALSLDPPLVVFSVGRSSRSWPGIERSGAFCVNILSTGQQHLCRTFAVSGVDKFADLDWSPSPVTGSPRLPASLAWIDCTIEAVHPGGDHHIVIGRVADLAVAESDVPPLLFYGARFHGLTS